VAEKSTRVCGLNFRLGVSSLDVDALRADGSLIDQPGTSLKFSLLRTCMQSSGGVLFATFGEHTVGRRRRAATGRSTISRGMRPGMGEDMSAPRTIAPPMNMPLELSVAAAVAVRFARPRSCE